MKLLCIIFPFLMAFSTFSQGKRIRRVTNDKGTIFLSWGYNVSAYTKSNLNLVGSQYNFTLYQSKGTDIPSDQLKNYTLNSLSIPQHNIKVGYYYKNKWFFSLALDHMKYMYSDYNQVQISGNATFPIQDVTLGNNQYLTNVELISQNIVTNRNQFNYNNASGLDYIHAELGKTKRWYEAGKKNDFTASTNVGFGAGLLYSHTSLLYNGVQGPVTNSLSGYGISGFAGLRFEAYKRFFLYTNFSLGFLHKVHEQTTSLDGAAYAKQKLGYSQIEGGIGLFLYKRTKNACNDCPVW